MNKEQQLLDIIAEILEIEEDGQQLTLSTELDEDMWDSLAIVSFISEVDSAFDKVLEPAAVGEAKTVADLVTLV